MKKHAKNMTDIHGIFAYTFIPIEKIIYLNINFFTKSTNQMFEA